MEAKQKKKLLNAFIYGLVASSLVVALFVFTANLFGMHFVLGFPLLLIEAEGVQDGTIVHISWFLPLVVGLLFAFFESFSFL